jgi:hypothetical protein
MLNDIYAECHKLALNAEGRYAECRVAQCRYAECYFAECRGTNLTAPHTQDRLLASDTNVILG